ncbi:MAG: mechanosensitive ion channel family protein [Bacteroidetes bacterium]|nr:mechanosensitive ion channel family protein [Bacteroidota bacterium]MBU1679226.1 mechanosensitive ion channel family protein [Bacteroidota bacterium]
MKNILKDFLGITPEFQIHIFSSLLVIFIIFLIYKAVVKLMISRIEDLREKHEWRRYSLYILVAIAALMLFRIWIGEFGAVATYFGYLSAGIAIALQDPLANFVGWIFIVIRQPFKIGDRVQIGETIGDVIDIRVFQFSVVEIRNWVDADQSTGRIIHIPNGMVFTNPQANYTAGFEYIWNEIPVLVTFESDWKKAKQILTEIVNKNAEKFSTEAEAQIRETAKKFFIYYNKLIPIVYTTVKDCGVLLTIRYIWKVRRRRVSDEVIWEDILTKFHEHKDIDFAYPTQRFYNHVTEGKMTDHSEKMED